MLCLANMVRKMVDWVWRALHPQRRDGDPIWENCDCIYRLVRDFRINPYNPRWHEKILFRTVFPEGTARYLEDSYLKVTALLDKCDGVVRVLNYPQFHSDSNATEKWLVEIAEDNGIRFALDRTKVLPTPKVLAREIAVLNHGVKDSQKVDVIAARLETLIAETMDDWGLLPQR